MPEHELEKLLGGFAADTLTDEERKLLFTAALQDQQLFNAMADEQALKELLADPAVRTRLLHALRQPKASGGSTVHTWLEWIRRPSGLAWVYGLAAAVFAVVLGTRIYQDSVRQAARSVATEDSGRAAPVPPVSQSVPPSPSNGHADQTGDRAHRDALATQRIRPESSVPAKPQAPPAPEVPREAPRQQSDPGQAPHARVPAAGVGKAQVEPADQSATLEPHSQAPSTGTATLADRTASALGARALFYGNTPDPATSRDRSAQGAAEDTRSRRMMTETPLKESKQAERGFGLPNNTDRGPSTTSPLGVRYSLIMAGPGGIDMEVDPATPVGKDDAPRLAIQTNEDGYLFLTYTPQPSDKPIVLFPATGNGRIAGRSTVPISLIPLFDGRTEAEQVRLLLVLSRSPRSTVPPDKQLSRPLIEQVDPSQPGLPTEQAVYVVNTTPTSPSLVVDIPLALRP